MLMKEMLQFRRSIPNPAGIELVVGFGDADVWKRAESLLDLHRRLESARSNAVGGSALIHAVEVHGIESRLRLLGAEDGVVGFEIAEIGSDVHWSRPPLAGGASGSSGAGGASGSSDDGQALYGRGFWMRGVIV